MSLEEVEETQSPFHDLKNRRDRRRRARVQVLLTSRNLPVSTSKMKPRTGMSLAIQGCDLTFFICSRVFSSGSLKEKKRIGAGDASPVEALSFSFSSSSVNVVNPQPVWLRSSISLLPSTRFET